MLASYADAWTSEALVPAWDHACLAVGGGGKKRGVERREGRGERREEERGEGRERRDKRSKAFHSLPCPHGTFFVCYRILQKSFQIYVQIYKQAGKKILASENIRN